MGGEYEVGRAERSEEISGDRKLEWEVRGMGVSKVQVQCFAHPHLNIFSRLSPDGKEVDSGEKEGKVEGLPGGSGCV